VLRTKQPTVVEWQGQLLPIVVAAVAVELPELTRDMDSSLPNSWLSIEVMLQLQLLPIELHLTLLSIVSKRNRNQNHKERDCVLSVSLDRHLCCFDSEVDVEGVRVLCVKMLEWQLQS
jgi:hypothetical protein